MELIELTALVKVVQTGSFTRAAQAMNTQKAYLSRVISGLEKKIGVRLIERTTRSLSLTEVGREIFERAVGILGAVDEVTHVAQQTLAHPRGLLKISCGVEFGMISVSGWVNSYLAQFPDVRIEADFTARIVDIVHEGFDVAIRLGDLADTSLVARKLGELQYGLFASEAYLRRKSRPQTAAMLANHELLVFNAGAQKSIWQLHNGADVCRVQLSSRLRVNNSFAICDAAIAGLGIALMPIIVARHAQEKGMIKRVLPGWAPPPVPVHAVFPSARYMTPKVRAFIDHAAASFYN
jgi:LysR family transcriptional regulator, regulator for bpeEF and oprC